MTSSRRRFLALVGAAATAGCLDRDGTGSPDRSPSPTPTPGGTNRDTLTPRNPDPLDVSGAWPQVGSDAGHDGVAQASGVPDAGRPYWQLRRVRSGPPVVGDGRLYHYARLGSDTGGAPTRTQTPPTGTSQPLAGAWHLVCRDAAEGRIQWTAPLEARTAGWPAVAGDRVLAGSHGRFAALDAGSGDPLWTTDLGDRDVGDPTVVGDAAVVPLPGVVSGESGEYLTEPLVRAYGMSDGAERWTVKPPRRGLAVAVDDGTAFVLSWSWDQEGTLQAVSLADGRERWRRPVPGSYFLGLAARDGAVCVSSSAGAVMALEAADGSRRWGRDFDTRPGGLAVDGSTVYVGHGSDLFALSVGDGSRRWTASVERDSFRTPAVGDGVVYAGTMGGQDAPLLAVDASTGDERWRHEFPSTTVEGDMIQSGVRSQPVVVDGGVYVNAVDGLYAFGPG